MAPGSLLGMAEFGGIHGYNPIEAFWVRQKLLIYQKIQINGRKNTSFLSNEAFLRVCPLFKLAYPKAG